MYRVPNFHYMELSDVLSEAEFLLSEYFSHTEEFVAYSKEKGK